MKATALKPATSLSAPAFKTLRTSRLIGFFEVAALAIAIMGPTATMALNGSLIAATDGTAIALAFVGATITIALVAYSFIEFGRQYAHAGSVYAFVGKSFGPRIGFVTAWTALFAYTIFSICGSILSADFMESFLGFFGVSIPWVLPALACMAATWLMVHRSIRLSTRSTLAVEGISVVLILVITGIVLHHGGAHGLSTIPFQIGKKGISAVALASVFGFLAFASFEGAATLGEETKNPRSAIPKALATAVLLTGVFYILVIYMEAEGFGATVAGAAVFAHSTAPLAELTQRYLGSNMAMIVDLGATASAFAVSVGLMVAAARMLFALARDGFGPVSLSHVHARFGSPDHAAKALVGVSAIGIITLYVLGNPVVVSFGYLGTIGVLAILLMYTTTQLAAIHLFSKNGVWKPIQLPIPILAIVLMVYTFYSNIYPAPAAPALYFPYIVVAWVVVGVIFIIKLPHLATKVGESMSRLVPFDHPLIESEPGIKT